MKRKNIISLVGCTLAASVCFSSCTVNLGGNSSGNGGGIGNKKNYGTPTEVTEFTSGEPVEGTVHIYDKTKTSQYVVKNGVTKTGNLKHSHKSDGFTYYDVDTNTFKTITYATTAGNIGTMINSLSSYYGSQKYTADSKAYKMLFVAADESSTATYWLASRNLVPGGYHYCYNFEIINEDTIESIELVGSNGYTNSLSKAVRAVVTLASGITLEDSTTITGTYDIVQ